MVDRRVGNEKIENEKQKEKESKDAHVARSTAEAKVHTRNKGKNSAETRRKIILHRGEKTFLDSPRVDEPGSARGSEREIADPRRWHPRQRRVGYRACARQRRSEGGLFGPGNYRGDAVLIRRERAGAKVSRHRHRRCRALPWQLTTPRSALLSLRLIPRESKRGSGRRGARSPPTHPPTQPKATATLRRAFRFSLSLFRLPLSFSAPTDI